MSEKYIWRLLEDGEVFQAGDEWYSENEWKTQYGYPSRDNIGRTISSMWSPVRRRVPVHQWPEPIKASERSPTKDECDHAGCVLFRTNAGWYVTNQLNINGRIDGEWMPLPPVPESEAEKAFRELASKDRPYTTEARKIWIEGYEAAKGAK